MYSVVRLGRSAGACRLKRVPRRTGSSPLAEILGVSRFQCRSSRASIPGALRYAFQLETPRISAATAGAPPDTGFRRKAPACSCGEPAKETWKASAFGELRCRLKRDGNDA